VRVVFLGTSAFAVPALLALARKHTIPLVVTQPDRPAGRHAVLTPSPVKVEARALGLPVADPERINREEALALLREAAPEAILVASYGQLLKRPVFSLPPLGTINLHASLLPRYRGAAPIHWAIVRGETETGVTTFLIDEGMDTGPVLLKRPVPIGEDETAGELHDRLAVLGADVILETLDGLAKGTLAPVPQPAEGATLAPRLERDDGRLDWEKTARELHNQVRGMNPWPGAFALLGEQRVKLHRTALTAARRGPVGPGEVALRETGRLLIGTGDELLEVLELQPEGRPRMTGRDFVNGLRDEVRFR
jgi:methionyl-tRNA formyltransferase